jgi:hypothetical protein
MSVVTFYRFIPNSRLPQRADRATGGTIPTRAFRYCEAIATAGSFGWYLFPPIDFGLIWDGAEVRWTFDGADGWYPLKVAQFPDFQAHFDALAPPGMRGFAPTFLGAPVEPGIVQVWTGYFAQTAPDWSLLVRPVANLPRRQGFEFFEGIIETDRWFGPLFSNLRLTRTNVPVYFRTDLPMVQIQPLHRSVYADDVLDSPRVVDGLQDLTEEDWSHFHASVVHPNSQANRLRGEYAIAVRRRKQKVK